MRQKKVSIVLNYTSTDQKRNEIHDILKMSVSECWYRGILLYYHKPSLVDLWDYSYDIKGYCKV
jgi:hypothetical protein